MSWVDDAKRRAANAAANHVVSGSVIGLGSGSTAAHFIKIIGDRLSSGALDDILGVPTSHQTAEDALNAAIPLTTLDEHPELDTTVDGADQVDGSLNAIKGGGGALLREKVVASASRSYILIADGRKLTERLGDGQVLPLEVLPFSLGAVLQRLEGLGCKPRLRMGDGELGPAVTDNGNFIVDADFGYIKKPKVLEADLKAIPGVLETGLFIGYADVAYIGYEGEVKKMERRWP
jgi:ribose 5-phosphate isomerase A